MKRFVLSVLALAGVGAALVVTASSTARQADEAGMKLLLVQGALVVLLEVINIAGTWLWLSDVATRVKVEAAIGVGLASFVTGTCGALTYGPIGLVAPAGLLAAVHLLSRLNTSEAPAETTVDDHRASPVTPVATVVTPTSDQTVNPGPPTEPMPVIEPDDETASDVPDPAPDRPALTDDAITAVLRSRSPVPGRDAVRTEFGIGTTRAERCIAAARKPALVKEGVS